MPAPSSPLDHVESRLFTTRDFRLVSGAVLPELTIAYETYGRLAASRRNAVLLTHGYSSSHHFAGHYRPGGAPRGLKDGDIGFWNNLVGPAKAVDTDRLFCVASNMLGSSYGSTSPASIDPRTGKPYGPTFPRITLADIVNAQKALLDYLGVAHLVAVVGGSYGGFQAFQWATTYPDFMDGVAPVITSPTTGTSIEMAERLLARLAKDPNWNDGWYYHTGGIKATMLALRIETLKSYGIEAQLLAQYPDASEREAAIVRTAEAWANVFDGHALVVLRRALEGFDASKDFARIKAKVLYVISRTDKLFPPSIAPGVMAGLRAAGVDARYVEIDSELGHMAPNPEAAKWAPDLQAFMEDLIAHQ